MRFLMPIAAVIALPLLAGACADLTPLQRDHQATVELLAQVEEQQYALECAPYELAMAQAHNDFAELEFEEGDPRRAQYHVAVARSNARIALEKAKACTPKDRDGDGIVDSQDACPDEPETVNGWDDADGCPDREPEPEVVKVVEPPPPQPGDQDGDGLTDNEDQCPTEPEDLDGFKDADGCPEADNDSDGVPDLTDRCPMAPEDFDGFEDADGCPDPDNDSDGILDEMDECPDQSEDFDGDRDGDGCPDLDRDGDGIPDDSDQCPDEAEVFNNYLDEDGCADTKPQRVEITKEQIVIKEQVQFQSGKSIIRPSSYPILDDVVQVLRDYPKIRIRIEGHTDSQGNDASNLRLSKSRADAVFEYILIKGIEASRLETVGFGETRPIDTNLTPEGRQKNRRVEFHIVSGMD